MGALKVHYINFVMLDFLWNLCEENVQNYFNYFEMSAFTTI